MCIHFLQQRRPPILPCLQVSLDFPNYINLCIFVVILSMEQRFWQFGWGVLFLAVFVYVSVKNNLK